jgi:cytochrome b
MVEEVKVWDPFVRIAHWTLAVSFFVAYLIVDDALGVHVWAGYLLGAVVILRILWGFVGSPHARFSDFIYRPTVVLAYLRDLVLLRSRRYLGHSPGGGAMVVALLVAILVTGATGLMTYAQEEGAGPLSGLIARQEVPSRTQPPQFDRERGEEGEGGLREVHSLAANLTLFLVIFHVLGVIIASYAHRENLALSMVNGRKRAE